MINPIVDKLFTAQDSPLTIYQCQKIVLIFVVSSPIKAAHWGKFDWRHESHKKRTQYASAIEWPMPKFVKEKQAIEARLADTLILITNVLYCSIGIWCCYYIILLYYYL